MQRGAALCSTHDPVIVGPGRWPEGIHWLPRYVLGQLRRVALGDVDTVGGWKPGGLEGLRLAQVGAMD